MTKITIQDSYGPTKKPDELQDNEIGRIVNWPYKCYIGIICKYIKHSDTLVSLTTADYWTNITTMQGTCAVTIVKELIIIL